MVRADWEKPVQGSRSYRVRQKLKWCKNSLIKWRKTHNGNARKEIELIQKEIEAMQVQGGSETRKDGHNLTGF